MEIKTKKHFNSLIKSLAEEILDEDDLDETTVTGNVVGYNTPFAFTGGKKKKKKYKDNTYRYKIGESLEKEDLVKIRKLIKIVVGEIFKDIWIKRTAWNK